MAEKGKEKKRDDDDEAKTNQLSPEERLAKLEKSRLIGTILLGVLLLTVIIETVFIAIIATQGADPRLAENTQQLENQQNDINRLKTAFESSQTFNDNALRLEGKLERIMTTIQLNNFSTLRKIMVEQEGSYQQFITALQQGMYDLSRMIKGSRTWYDVYKDDLDLVIGDSKVRAESLSAGLAEPLKRETISEGKE